MTDSPAKARAAKGATGGEERPGWDRLVYAIEIVIFLVLLVVVWAAAVRGLGINALLLPDPVDVWSTGVEFAGLILPQTAYTLGEAMLGFGLAVLVGTLIGLGVCYIGAFRRFVLPSVAALNATPSIVVAPLFVIWLGFEVPSKIAMAFLISLFPIVINSARGLASVEPELLDFYHLVKASEWQIFWRLRIPSALPALFDGMKLALPISIIGAIIGEFVASRVGIGYQIIVAYSNLDTAFVFAAVITVAVSSTILFQLLRALERRALRWKE